MTKCKGRARRILVFAFAVLLLLELVAVGRVYAQEPDTIPDHVVKLVFIHHSCGENWLTDGHGNLGQVLAANNYFVSDTNYGWGPHSIGDRTDILDWPEWFVGPDSTEILAALYQESGQNSSYSRSLGDPGGENEIVMFKSCFPNSELAGAPADAATAGSDLSVASAKYVYNQLLSYFQTRPDKLFIIITAPPVQEHALAANARAFNIWLVEDWLQENGYPLNNVAVWDFYNVLTDSNNHHRVQAGVVEYIFDAGGDVLYYPDNGDTHPSTTGNQKATQEYIPFLNYVYNRWQGTDAVQTVDIEPDAVAAEPDVAPAAMGSGFHDPLDSMTTGVDEGWQAFFDPSGNTSLGCQASNIQVLLGEASMQIEYDIASGSWATCSRFFSGSQDWSAAEGLLFHMYPEQAGFDLHVDLYMGPDDARQTYLFPVSVDDAGSWIEVSIPWEQFARAEWEAEGGVVDPTAISGLAYGFSVEGTERLSGTIYIDDVELMVSDGHAVGSDAVSEEPGTESSMDFEARPSLAICPQTTLMILMLVVGVIVLSRRFGL